jgi:branched-chain amino acid transport system substrate-binding protein
VIAMNESVEAGRQGAGARGALARARWGAGLALLAVVAAAAPSCSVVVDGSAQQCSSNDECADFPGTECKEGTCQTPDVPCATNAECGGIEGGACVDGVCLANQNTCATTAECIQANGENFICKNPVRGARECVSLVNEDCLLVEGPYDDENAVFIGSVLPLLTENDDTGVSSQNGARLAIQEIQGNAGGLPAIGGTGRRPLVLVSCNDNSDKDSAVRAANYLADVVGVQAIIGASFSGLSLGVATESTIQRGVLLFSPSATSVALTDLADKDQRCVEACAGDADCQAACPGLFWRTSPNDEFQSAALAAYLPIVEERVRTDLALEPTEDIRVLLLHKGDAYGEGISRALEEQLRFNGETAAAQTGGNYVRYDYGDPDNKVEDPPTYGEAIAKVLEEQPHIVFVLGTQEGIDEIIAPVEEEWDGAAIGHEVEWILGDGGFVTALETVVAAQPTSAERTSLRKRLRGSVPGTSAENNPVFSTFVNSYQFSEGTPTTFGAAGAYDIVYLIAFGMASAGAQPLTGTNIARGLLRTVPPGTSIRVGPGALNTGFGVMTNPSGGNMDFEGASGPLDFDVTTGEAASDILIWCMRTNSQGQAVRQIESGLLYSATELELVGTEENCD